MAKYISRSIRSLRKVIDTAQRLRSKIPATRRGETDLTFIGISVGTVIGLIIGGSIGIATGGWGFGVGIWMVTAIVGGLIGNRFGLERDRRAERKL